jgi:hypothetical protein
MPVSTFPCCYLFPFYSPPRLAQSQSTFLVAPFFGSAGHSCPLLNTVFCSVFKLVALTWDLGQGPVAVSLFPVLLTRGWHSDGTRP